MIEWISIEDRLPPLMHKVLFFCVQDNHVANIYMGYCCEAGWDIYLPYHQFKLRAATAPVYYWAELPDYPMIYSNALNRWEHREQREHMDEVAVDEEQIQETQ